MATQPVRDDATREMAEWPPAKAPSVFSRQRLAVVAAKLRAKALQTQRALLAKAGKKSSGQP